MQPVTSEGFNVGDFDHNDLLTGEQDLFETGGPEVWLFTCTTTVTVDTVNTVTVVGTPVRAGGRHHPARTRRRRCVQTPSTCSRPTSPRRPRPWSRSNPPSCRRHRSPSHRRRSPCHPPLPTTVEQGGGTLPATGLHGGNELAAALGTIAVGLGLVSLTRRRVRHRP